MRSATDLHQQFPSPRIFALDLKPRLCSLKKFSSESKVNSDVPIFGGLEVLTLGRIVFATAGSTVVLTCVLGSTSAITSKGWGAGQGSSVMVWSGVASAM